VAAERAPILVGVDGSGATDAALRWAIAEARASQLPLRLVNGFAGEGLAHSVRAPGPPPDEPQARAVHAVEQAAAHVHAIAPDVVATGEARDREPVDLLVDESGHASLVVLGSRQLKAIGATVLGSIGVRVAAAASVPVVVVRGEAGSIADGAAVVAGVDGTSGSQAVLRFAFDYAKRHGAVLRPVFCWHPDIVRLALREPQPVASGQAEAVLADALAGWGQKYPDVTVRPTALREYPTAGLVMESTEQHLLVVGRHRRNAIAAALLGSVSQGVLHHASCPVAVVPAEPEHVSTSGPTR
jgi:nucleotide-binding universal stress UspA family protein